MARKNRKNKKRSFLKECKDYVRSKKRLEKYNKNKNESKIEKKVNRKELTKKFFECK